MEIRHLRYFVVLYQQSNFTKAAELLFLSQSALSQQIMQLENELGFSLFVRNTKKQPQLKRPISSINMRLMRSGILMLFRTMQSSLFRKMIEQ